MPLLSDAGVLSLRLELPRSETLVNFGSPHYVDDPSIKFCQPRRQIVCPPLIWRCVDCGVCIVRKAFLSSRVRRHVALLVLPCDEVTRCSDPHRALDVQGSLRALTGAALNFLPRVMLLVAVLLTFPSQTRPIASAVSHDYVHEARRRRAIHHQRVP